MSTGQCFQKTPREERLSVFLPLFDRADRYAGSAACRNARLVSRRRLRHRWQGRTKELKVITEKRQGRARLDLVAICLPRTGMRSIHAVASGANVSPPRTLTLTSTIDPSRLMDRHKAIGSEPPDVGIANAREIGRRNPGATVRSAHTLRPSPSSALMISAARMALKCWASAFSCPRSRKTFPLPRTTFSFSLFIARA